MSGRPADARLGSMLDVRRPSARTVLRTVVPGVVAAAGIALGLPRLLGVSWADVGAALTAVRWWAIVALAVVWVTGLWAHTIALSAAMPGLGRSRALLLNLTGSCVSNLVPLGGAAGTVTNYAMSRSWGYSRAAFVRWAAVTNVWDNLIKLALPTVALAWLASSGSGTGSGLAPAAFVGLVGFAVLTALGAAVLTRPGWLPTLGSLADAVVRRIGRGPKVDRYARRAAELRDDCLALVARAWGRLTFGKVAYAVLQAVLCWGCLAATGASAGPEVVFAAFALERLLSVLVLTPGATGFVEVGMTGLLVALGVEPVPAAAGVLLYRFFTFAMEIPVGGVGLLWWWHRRAAGATSAVDARAASVAGGRRPGLGGHREAASTHLDGVDPDDVVLRAVVPGEERQPRRVEHLVQS
jgi:uncharacterized membrane protein YbhN (UPF0104 family)